MGNLTFNNKEDTNTLADIISADGESFEFPRHETEKSGRRYLIACSQNDQEERARRAGILKDVSRTKKN